MEAGVIFFGMSFITIFIFFLITIILSIYKNIDIKSNNGIFLLDIDLKNNRLRKSNFVQNLNRDNEYKNFEYFEEGWMDINSFLENLSEKNRKKIMVSLDEIKFTKQYVKFGIKNKSFKHHNYSTKLNIELFKNSNLVNAIIEWNYFKDVPLGLKIINKEELFQNKSKFQSFIAFNLITNSQSDLKSFITILYENLKLKNLDFFISKNIVILIIYGENTQDVEQKINFIIKKIEEIKFMKRLLCYYDAIGIVESDGVDNSKDLLKIINRIYFSLIKSSQLEKTFYFNMKNIFFNEFEEFKENYSILNNIIKTNDIPSKTHPIFEVKTNNVIANYIKPNPEYPVNFWTNMIIKNKNILPNLEDSYFDKILNSLDKLDQYLIDINDYLIVQNIDKVKNFKSMFFIITFTELSNIQNLELIIQNLKRKNIKFGIKINKIIPEIISLIETITPHIIIIEHSLVNNTNFKMFLNLKELLNLCKKNPATLIFQNPSKFELSHQSIKYYFNE